MAFLLISMQSEKTGHGFRLRALHPSTVETTNDTKDYKRGEEDCKNFWRSFHDFMVLCKLRKFSNS